MRLRMITIRAIKLLVLLFLVLLIYPAGYFVLNNTALYPDNDYKKTENKNEDKNSYKGTGAYIINLDRCKERYEYVQKNVSKLNLPVERITAVDGKSLSAQQLQSLVDYDMYNHFFNHVPKKGTIGCSLSHIKAWKTFLESHFEYAVIFEDDVSFIPEKLAPVIHELTNIPKDWDISNFEIHHRSVPLTVKSLVSDQKLVVYLTNVSHTGAYMINRHAAEQLLAKALPIKMPVDHYFTRVWELGLTFTGVENPRLVHQTYGDSEIAKSDRVQNKSVSIQGIQRTIYKVKTSIIRAVYNMGCYIKSFFKNE